MDISKELLCNEIGALTLKAFPEMEAKLRESVALKAVETLQKIKAVLENDGLDDFMCVDEILRILESSGITAGSRHDFG